MTWRMMQWLLATIFVILSPAELRVSKQTPGQQRTSAAVSGFGAGDAYWSGRFFQPLGTWGATPGIYVIYS